MGGDEERRSRVGFEGRESGEVGPARRSSKIYLVKMPGVWILYQLHENDPEELKIKLRAEKKCAISGTSSMRNGSLLLSSRDDL